MMKQNEHFCGFMTIIVHLWIYLDIKQVLSYDVRPQREKYTPNYGIYHNLSSINSVMQNLIKEHSNIIQDLSELYLSRDGNSQHVVHIGANPYSNNSETVKILLSFGEHAREFLPIESLFYFLNIILQSKNEQDIDLKDFDVYVIVIANPDGRLHVEQTKNFCWRGTANGVDINRNFEWEFGGKGSSADKTDEEYRGPFAFSEPETRVYRQLTKDVKFDAFLSLHSGIKQIYVPYADTKSKATNREHENIAELMKLAEILSTCTSYRYQYGKAADLNDYTADGTVFDYMAGVKHIPFTYAIELWGPERHTTPSCFDLFNPANEQLKTVVEKIYPLYVNFFHYLLSWKKSKQRGDNLINQPRFEKKEKNRNLQRMSVLFNEPYPPLYTMSKEDARSPRRTPEQSDSLLLEPVVLFSALLILMMILFSVKERVSIFRLLPHQRRIINLRNLGASLPFLK
ncbi:carboxypeptidase O-like isoform X1 [Mya arenaria]|uniref:carboxypeptidase O-like isoform X1 n=1 Tax=Mya arenaria TaxID=6604 RepID=UPI0022E65D12|nr:carboxypeptidase O-like isoform X1 [Mya arenaria]